MKEADKIITELEWFRSVLIKGGKIPEYYEAQSSILTKAIKTLEQTEQKWILCSERIPDEGCECWITAKTTEEVYRGIFTEFYGVRHDVGFICDDGFMWWNTAKAWMYCEKPEPYKESEDLCTD